MNDPANTTKPEILIQDEGLDAIGEAVMRVTAFGLRAGLYDMVPDSPIRSTSRYTEMQREGMRFDRCLLDDGIAERFGWTGDPKEVEDMACHVLLKRELSDAIRDAGLDPTIVAAEALEGQIMDARVRRTVEDAAKAMVTATVPQDCTGTVYTCLRSPWTPVTMLSAFGEQPMTDVPMPELEGPAVLAMWRDDRTTLMIGVMMVEVKERSDPMERLRLVA